MKPLIQEVFQAWMESCGKASKQNDTQVSAELFAPNAKYYETPFTKLMVGRKAIYQNWSQGAQYLRDKEPSFKTLSMKGNLGIARWQSNFIVIKSGKRDAPDCLFLVVFGEHEKCSVFREWWHLKEVDTSQDIGQR